MMHEDNGGSGIETEPRLLDSGPGGAYSVAAPLTFGSMLVTGTSILADPFEQQPRFPKHEIVPCGLTGDHANREKVTPMRNRILVGLAAVIATIRFAVSSVAGAWNHKSAKTTLRRSTSA